MVKILLKVILKGKKEKLRTKKSLKFGPSNGPSEADKACSDAKIPQPSDLKFGFLIKKFAISDLEMLEFCA